MGIQDTQFRLYRYTSQDECRHDVLVRVNRPGYPNADQTADDAAQDFANSAADHLRSWWERWLLPRHCRREHESRLVKTFLDVVSDELQGPGLREMTVWEAEVDGEPYLAAASTEEEFWRQLEDDYAPDEVPTVPRQAVARSVYFLTEQDGTGDLSDA